jgi:hypothetical protein
LRSVGNVVSQAPVFDERLMRRLSKGVALARMVESVWLWWLHCVQYVPSTICCYVLLVHTTYIALVFPSMHIIEAFEHDHLVLSDGYKASRSSTGRETAGNEKPVASCHLERSRCICTL